MNSKLTAALHITRKSGPWIGIAACFIIAVNDLKKSK